MTATRDSGARWLKSYGRGGSAEIRLFCLHHAGGTAAMYRDWGRRMPAWIEPVAVQLPGRGDRFLEPPLDAMEPLLDALVEVFEPLLDQAYACYGLSMGARVAWALTHRLRDKGLPLPRMLFLASAAAPCWEEGRADWGDSEADLIGYLREMGGTPPEVFAEPELLASLLPILRADLTLVDSYRFRPDTPLDLPIRAFAGIDDVEGSPERMSGWRDETRGRFDLDVVAGGHFFDASGEEHVVRTIVNDLERELTGRRPSFM